MKNCIGIRQENKDRTERRAPLTPAHVRQLVEQHGLRVLVEPAPNRVFREEEYRQAGAEICDNLEEANIIFGVKEIPKTDLQPQSVYCFFSHTIKAQPYNMPMLKRIMELQDTLLDYELVTNEKGVRQIFFGNFAGYAGMIDSLWAMGQRTAWEGLDTPFREIEPAHHYASLEEAKNAVKAVGEKIGSEGLPAQLTPFICGFSGYGQVSKGAQEIFDLLPVTTIEPEELAEFWQTGQFSNTTLYKVEFKEIHMFRLNPDIDGKTEFDLQEYFQHPERYQANFPQYLPYLSMLINGIYWTPECPRLISKADLQELYRREPHPRLRVIGDIYCDIDGSIQMTVKATNSENPVYVYDPQTGAVRHGVAGNGPVIMAVDKLPTELPREASQFFGDALLPFAPALAKADFSADWETIELPEEFRRAVIIYRGELTEKFKFLEEHVQGA